jgi:hypothetical protein
MIFFSKNLSSPIERLLLYYLNRTAIILILLSNFIIITLLYVDASSIAFLTLISLLVARILLNLSLR